MAFLDLALRVLAYDDQVATSNPQRRHVDRNDQVRQVPIGTPLSYPLAVAAGETVTVFDGARAVGLDGTTELALTVSPLDASRYRLKWTGVGTNAAFETERALAASGSTVTVTLNANLSVTITGSGPAYSNVQVGDTVLIPGLATGDSAGPFDSRNTGYWTVIGVTPSSITLARAPGWSGAATQTLTVGSNDQIVAFGLTGARVDDQLEIKGGFSTNARRVYRVLSVSPRWVDIQSTVPLAPETAVAGSNGLFVYAAARRALHLEIDSLVTLTLNGVSAAETVEPLLAPDGSRLGRYLKTGPVWQLKVGNPGAQVANGLAVAFP